MSLLMKMKLYRKAKAKNEVSLIVLKLNLLTDELRAGRNMNADKKYWDFYISRFDEILKEFDFKEYKEDFNAFKMIYDEFILKKGGEKK